MNGHYHFSRILDIPCEVCGDFSSGKHYSIFACDGCAGFFKRSIRSSRQYLCRAVIKNTCIIDKTHRNQCKACRLRRCLQVGMNKDAVQHERGSRKTKTISQEFGKDIGTVLPQSNALSEAAYKKLPLGSLSNSSSSLKYAWSSALPLNGIEREIDLCENAAQLLFMNMQWVKNIAAFTSLPFTDQLLLVEECWKELFILGATQFLPFEELSAWLETCRVLQLKEYHKLKDFHELLTDVNQFNLDQYEFTYLRLIVLFSPFVRNKRKSDSDRIKMLTNAVYINFVRNYLQLKLNKFVEEVKPNQPLRFKELMQLVLSLNCILDDTIEDLFFKKTIGNVPMAKIISDMYKTYSTNNL
ncbi:nuclear receptor subfamily 2 group E member 1-like [Anoplophora glabripennis]|uniref:nuclear receptor subfamily 2 group E member 1-like n=1 Tax=Anoplophora glabripennis TaxID=217634 RepID=UPI000C78E1D1|nr:nuclear receptor subfamily 2 group E member 1-like [Anoplophora glabripennis]